VTAVVSPMHLTVIIPTRDRLPVLRATLAGLAEQELGPVEAEVIVVDNGSTDGTTLALTALAADFPLPLIALHEPIPGAGPARNRGLKHARGDAVLFLGDDTRPAAPDLLRRHAELHDDTRAILGRVAWAPHLTVTPLMRWLEHGAQFAYADMQAGPAGPEHFYTAHVSASRAVLQEAGGFDPRIPFDFEDGELGQRLVARGLAIEYHPELLVHHDHPITLESWIRRQERVGAAGRRVLELHDLPERIVPRPGGWRWTAATAIAKAAGTPATEWQRLPAGIRDRLYAAAHFAAYARGYRRP
jgi:glycosyltransferase involved in cell wall biosynthesis